MKDELVALVPVIGVLGVVVGAFLQGFLNRKNQRASSFSELQNKAYSDFLNSVSKIAVAQRKDQRTAVTEELLNLADAKSRICVYGHASVVHHLADFLRAGVRCKLKRNSIVHKVMSPDSWVCGYAR